MGHRTTIIADVEDNQGHRIRTPITEHCSYGGGDPDRPNRVHVTFLPADVDQDAVVGPSDLLEFRQYLSNVITPARGEVHDYADIDRDGRIFPFDLLKFRQLVNGVLPATQVWNGATLNTTSQPCP